MMKRILAVVLSLAISFDASAQNRPNQIVGPSGAPVKQITGSACTQIGGVVTCVAGAGGTGTPGGVSGDIQKNDGVGGFGVYTGTSCAYAVKTLDSKGASTCTAAPTIPADISGAHYVTTQAEAGLSAEAVVPTCTGTQKLTFNGTSLSCATDSDTVYSLPAATASVLGGVKGTGSSLTCSAGQKATGFDAAGALQCATDADTIYTLPTPTASTLGGVKSLTCGGTDKLSAIGTDGIPVCSTDSTGGGGAPTTATYITQTPDATLSAEQALSGLGTGLMKSTTGTGVVSIAVAGTDYQSPISFPLNTGSGGTGGTASPTSGAVAYGTGSAYAFNSAGASGQGLFSGGTGAPTWGDETRVVRLTSDYTNATTTLSNTALTWTSPAQVSRSAFYCKLMVKSSATTLGTQVDVNASVTPTTITYWLNWISAAGTPPATTGTWNHVTANANATLVGPTTGLTAYTLWQVEGIIVHTASSSTVTIRGKASGVGTVTIGSGSYCSYYVL